MRTAIFVLFVWLVMSGALSGSAQPPEVPVTRELVVLIAPDTVTPQEVVDAVNDGGPVPGGLGEGGPVAARMVVNDPARGRLAEWISHNPDVPEARMQRFVVLRYPDEADVEAIRDVLAGNANVQNVAMNLLFRLHAVPDDPYVGTGNEPPGDAQWGVHVLNLPAAWDHMTGHAYLGILDEGLETAHPELRASHEDLGTTVFDGGAYRAHLSRDVLNDNCSVDEADPDDTHFDPTPGHGTHVMGIAAANTDNATGVAGTCWDCSVLMTKVSPVLGGDVETFFSEAASGLFFVNRRGAQALNMSFGVNINMVGCDVGPYNLSTFCTAMALGELRDVVMVASAGNDLDLKVDFPARDPRTIAVSGLELDPVDGPVIWRRDVCPFRNHDFECGSSIGPNLDLMAPAAGVLSTIYSGQDHNANLGCGDSFFPVESGYGLCTGTSMSSPFVTGLAGLVRSANPLLGREAVRNVLTSTASIPGPPDPVLAHGLPDAQAAVTRALGTVAGQILRNRLTPLFVFHSPPPVGAAQAETHTYTTVPQVASYFLLNDVRDFETVGLTTAFYQSFPGFCVDGSQPDCCPVDQACCVGQGEDCLPRILTSAETRPEASVFVFTNELSPTTTSLLLSPLYRLRYESALDPACESPPVDPVSPSRDFVLATSSLEVEALMNGVSLGGSTFEYVLDGIEGWVYSDCSAGCPGDEVALHRLYHEDRHDFVVVPTSEVSAFEAQGYAAPNHPDLPEIIGYAYANVDADGDGLIDGFEALIGSDRLDSDSDGDGVSDGGELLFYDASDPDPALHGYGDPCSNGCPIFTDGFESGNTTQWSSSTP